MDASAIAASDLPLQPVRCGSALTAMKESARQGGLLILHGFDGLALPASRGRSAAASVRVATFRLAMPSIPLRSGSGGDGLH